MRHSLSPKVRQITINLPSVCNTQLLIRCNHNSPKNINPSLPKYVGAACVDCQQYTSYVDKRPELEMPVGTQTAQAQPCSMHSHTGTRQATRLALLTFHMQQLPTSAPSDSDCYETWASLTPMQKHCSCTLQPAPSATLTCTRMTASQLLVVPVLLNP